MLTLESLKDAERFVERQESLGNDIEWDGWDIVFYRPDSRAMTSKFGVFRNGEWAYKNVSALQDDGTWLVDWRNVRRRNAV